VTAFKVDAPDRSDGSAAAGARIANQVIPITVVSDRCWIPDPWRNNRSWMDRVKRQMTVVLCLL
jgi:hypothetical protein